MRVSTIQMISGPDVTLNLIQAKNLIEQASNDSAELVVLPEYFCLIGNTDQEKLAIAETQGNGPIQSFLSEIAKQHKIYLVAGTIPLKGSQSNKARNSVLVYNPEGVNICRYDKIHLFKFDNGKEAYDESIVLEPGQNTQSFELESKDGNTWKIGLSVCYDLRFAELYQQLQADLLLVPAAFTFTTGKAHWETLLKARAIENLAYVVASAQGGEHPNGRKTFGHSMLINPWGEVLASVELGVTVCTADLDFTMIQAKRAQLPALEHRVL